VTPTAAFVRDGKLALDAAIDRKRLSKALGEGADFIDATGIATALTGDSIATNLFMLGFAWQRGRVPLSFAALDRAIELNAVAVEANRRAFAWGRLAAHDRAAIDALVTPAAMPTPMIDTDLDALVADRADELTRYQNAAYADRYRATVAVAADAERRLGAGESGFALAVARYLYKLMAYKDEYEVARLYTDGRFVEKLKAQFDGDYRLEFNLAPPIFARRDPITGHLRKRAFGPWMMQAFRLLAHAKFLRGTALDPFGRTAERRNERAMIADYERLVRDLSATLTPTNHAAAIDLASLPDAIRGYGHVKHASVEAADAERPNLVARFEKGETAEAIAAE
jgi:indolepyruvate ferredoxin oxidoreductase